MSCSNCFNGCAEIVSDKCVKYTGINIPELGIETGDPLLVVENKITEKILEIMTGEGIIPKIDQADLCELVSSYLPCCDATTITLNDVLSALIQSVCELDERLEALKQRVIKVEDALVILNADYTLPPGCLAGVTPDTDTHGIVQAVINAFCELKASLPATYVRLDQLPTLIQQYLSGLPTVDKQYAKMVPNTAYAYFGSLAKFGATGAGSDEWEKVYLCDGRNDTPDLRGVTLVGVTNGSGMDPLVAPSTPSGSPNPNYQIDSTKGTIHGRNEAFIANITQMPSHNHAATVRITDPGHKHTYVDRVFEVKADFDENEKVWRNATTTAETGVSQTGLKGGDGVTITTPPQNVFVDILNKGGVAGQVAGHPNIQPSKATNYIMYIP